MDANDKVIIFADTRHIARWFERKIDPHVGDLAFFCNCLMTLQNLRLWAHERTPGVPRNVVDLETNELADVLGTIVEDQHSTVLKYVSQVQWRIKLHDTIRERFTKSWKTNTWKKETSWKKLIEKPIYLNKYLFLVTQSQRKNVYHLGFVSLAAPASQSDGYIEICDTYRKKHQCKCYVPLELPQDYTNAAKIF